MWEGGRGRQQNQGGAAERRRDQGGVADGGGWSQLVVQRRVGGPAESRKLWEIVGPAIFSRIATYSMNVITQAFAGHLGDLELAAISIANTVVVGFNYGLMVRVHIITPRSATLPAFIQLLDRYTCYSLSTLG
ncbi:hypothetical protein PVAP13_9NG814900 [Panicum virgatum]|uniref:Protein DETOXIFICATION n=1 Tax=Panicum virgatum TaxID=38727 RepID=A0A8T0N456_PANVG|nr:hypothetical protein PVAP13_9NG814900 [Panicum virgatum]